MWLLLSTIFKFASNAVLYIVDDTWQTPPPTSGTTFPPIYAVPSLKPASIVLEPTTVLNEKFSPGIITVPFTFWAANFIFTFLL